MSFQSSTFELERKYSKLPTQLNDPNGHRRRQSLADETFALSVYHSIFFFPSRGDRRGKKKKKESWVKSGNSRCLDDSTSSFSLYIYRWMIGDFK